MRLIDANELLRALALEPMENRTYWRANEIVLNQPTAYDTDEAIKQYEIGFDDGFEQASEIDLQELKKQIKNGDFRTFINNGKVYLEDVIDGEAIMIYELKTGEQE